MHHSELAQLVEHTTVNRAVVGSSPTFGVSGSFHSEWLFLYNHFEGDAKMKITMEEQVKQLVDALHEAQQEADKWRTGAEIYEAQATESQETMQLMAEEIDQLRKENEQLHQVAKQQGHSTLLTPTQQPEIAKQELARHKIIEDALINKIQQLEYDLANR